MVTIIISLLLAVSISACGDSNGTTDENTENQENSEEKVYLEESEIANLFSDPDDYKGKYVKMSGRVFTAPEKKMI